MRQGVVYYENGDILIRCKRHTDTMFEAADEKAVANDTGEHGAARQHVELYVDGGDPTREP